MGYPQGQEFSEGDQGLTKPPEGQQRQASAEQWQNISTLNKPDAGQLMAQQSVDELFGCPAIVGADGKTYLQEHVSNVPEVSQGVQNLDV